MRKFCLYLVFILLSVAMLFPLFWGISSSFRSDTELFQYAMPLSIHTFIPVEFTANAYVRLFTEFGFLRPILNTLYITFATIISSAVINSLAAFAFAFFDFKFKKVIYAIVLMTFMIPFESIAMPLYKIVNDLNWVDTFTGMIVPGIANGLVLFLFTQFFLDFPVSLFESARIDGASWLTIFKRILLPLSKPIFITAGLMIFMQQWNSYLWPLVVGVSDRVRVIQTAMGVFQQQKGTLWSCLYAASMLSAIIPLFVFLPLQKYYVQGITSSGIKS